MQKIKTSDIFKCFIHTSQYSDDLFINSTVIFYAYKGRINTYLIAFFLLLLLVHFSVFFCCCWVHDLQRYLPRLTKISMHLSVQNNWGLPVTVRWSNNLIRRESQMVKFLNLISKNVKFLKQLICYFMEKYIDILNYFYIEAWRLLLMVYISLTIAIKNYILQDLIS